MQKVLRRYYYLIIRMLLFQFSFLQPQIILAASFRQWNSFGGGTTLPHVVHIAMAKF